MKIAITGKGGVGKTTLCAILARLYSQSGGEVFAIDADPDANLASALGHGQAGLKIVPLIRMKDLITERTGASPGSYSGFFTLNPKVADLPEKYSVNIDGIKLMVLGTIYKGGSGCACPENALLKALINHLFVERDAVVLLDMEAGVEHLGRATAAGVDMMIVVVEPGRRSVDTALQIRSLAADIGIKRVAVAGNKFSTEKQKRIVVEHLAGMPVLGFISRNDALIDADLNNRAAFEGNERIVAEVEMIKEQLDKTTLSSRPAG